MKENERLEKRFQQDLEALRLSFRKFLAARTNIDKRLYWGSFLKYFRICTNLFIKLTTNDRTTRGLASKARSEKKKDPVVFYLLSSRDDDEHTDEKGGDTPGEVLDGQVVVPGFGSVGYNENTVNSEMYFSRNTFGSSPLPDGSVIIESGNVDASFGKKKFAKIQKPSFKLNPCSTRKGKLVPVPNIVKDGLPTPAEFAGKYALAWLEKKVEQRREQS